MAGVALRTTWYHCCVTGTALYTNGVETSQDALVRGRQKSRRIASFLMLSTSEIEEVSSRRTASFLTLSSSKFEEV